MLWTPGLEDPRAEFYAGYVVSFLVIVVIITPDRIFLPEARVSRYDSAF
jgi:hypothetical protein